MIATPSVPRLLVALVLAIGAVASSQASHSDQVWHSGQDLEERLQGVDRGLFSRVPVVGAPFSGAVTTTWQRSGSHPVRRALTKYFRDASGRVRAEQSYTDVRTNTSTRRLFVAPEPQSPTVLVLDQVDAQWRPIPRASAAMIVGTPFGLTLPIADRCVLSLNLPQVWQAFFHGLETVTEKALGRRSLQGLTVDGYASETTLPAGSFSLKYDVVVRNERWVSPDLRLLIYSRTLDTVAGLVEYELAHINRAEPLADLFTVADAPPAPSFLEVRQEFVSPYVKPSRHDGPCDRLP